MKKNLNGYLVCNLKVGLESRLKTVGSRIRNSLQLAVGSSESTLRSAYLQQQLKAGFGGSCWHGVLEDVGLQIVGSINNS